MLVEDVAAFVEQLEILKDRKRADKHRRRVTQAELDVLEAQRDVRLAAEALHQLELRLARGAEPSSTAAGRGLFGRRHARSLTRELKTIGAHLAAKRDELSAKGSTLNDLRKRGVELGDARNATMFRLHSGAHHVDCSASRYERLAAAQLEAPVAVARKNGRCWWWYLDRFWWGDEGLTASDIEELVLESDLRRKHESEAIAEARVLLLGHPGAPLLQEHVSDAVKTVVWRRDRGRCVDCGSGESVVFDYIVPVAQSGSDTAANVELRCQPCRVRLARNETRTRVSRARADAAPHYRDERVSA